MIPQPIDQVPLFLKLDEEERELLTGRLKPIEFNTHDLIFTSGKPSEALYVILSGWVKLETETPGGVVPLANLGAGSLIGEVDLLLGRVYSASARAATSAHLLSLARSDLEDLITQRPSIGLKFSTAIGARVVYLEDYLVNHRLRGVSLLSALADQDLRAIAAQLEFKAFPRGHVLVEAGTPAQALHLIEEGQVRVITPSHEGEAFDDLDAGDLFGQNALLSDKPYPATVRAVTDVSVWMLSRLRYQQIIREHPAVKLAMSRALSQGLSAVDQSLAVERLQQLSLFSDVPNDALREIAARLVLQHFPGGETIYAEGTPGDALYLIESGEVKLVADVLRGGNFLDRKSAGEVFGEMALLTGRTRGETAKANSDTTVWVLFKSDYDDLMVKYPELSLALTRALSDRLKESQTASGPTGLKRIALFANLSQHELAQIAPKLEPLKFRAGEIICFAGQAATHVFFINGGEVKEFAGGQNQIVVLGMLGAGDSFGEQAVMHTGVYTATAQAMSDVEIWTLAKSDFDTLLTQIPTLAVTVSRRMAEQLERANARLSQPSQPAPQQPSRAMPPQSARPARPAPPAAARRPQFSTISIPKPPPVQHKTITMPQPSAPPARPVNQGTIVGVRKTTEYPWQRKSGVVRPMPAATARPVARAATTTRTFPGIRARPPAQAPSFFAEVGDWFTALSTGAKMRLALVGCLLLLLLGIVAPATAITVVAQNLGNFLSPAPTQETPRNENRVTTAKTSGVQSLGDTENKVAMAKKTPTPTPVPPTPTPTPTVKPKAPVVSKPKPTAPPPTQSAPPAEPRPALVPVQWDSRLGPGGLPLLGNIGIDNAPVQSGQAFWRVTKVQFEDYNESNMNHNIYVTILDENGKRLEDQTIVIQYDDGGLKTERKGIGDQKPNGDYCNCNYDYPMYGAAYTVWIDGNTPSDKVHGMIMPMHRHVNYRVWFQRVVMP